jgi:hypothetical protein
MVKPTRLRGACIYVEGAEREDLRRAAREAFSKLFAPTLGHRKPSFIFCGSRLEAFNQFKDHIELRRAEAALLVVDAEDVVASSSTRWEHVRKRKGDGWAKPKGTTEADLRFMSVVMESWCIADAFPTRPLERIPKDEVFATLKKRGWTKEGANSFLLVAKADVQLLVKRSPEFKALCERLRALSS